MDNDVIIKVEGLGKKYRLRARTGERYTALRDVITDKAKGLFRRNGQKALTFATANPSAGGSDLGPLPAAPKPGEGGTSESSRSSREDFWALKNVSFEVKQGEVVGIIGRNGAGKSTLLKILSRITEPTEGKVRIKGRVASLLEVGTGFHLELSGRENIYLNGAILGMSRTEIREKFDEIVSFAEVEKFLDMPVKRYSSGMYVRLAFAVAAHLEPEILVVDEVLAVGDAEFQKKCLGKMGEIARSGRTVLFVSHNMMAITNLTNRCFLLEAGRIVSSGVPDVVVKKYALSGRAGLEKRSFAGSGEHTLIRCVDLLNENGESTRFYDPTRILRVAIELETDGESGMSVDLFLCDANRTRIAFGSTAHFGGISVPAHAGIFKCEMRFPPLALAAGEYSFDVATAITNLRWDHFVEEAVRFEVTDYNPCNGSWAFMQSRGYGAVALVPLSTVHFAWEQGATT